MQPDHNIIFASDITYMTLLPSSEC